MWSADHSLRNADLKYFNITLRLGNNWIALGYKCNTYTSRVSICSKLNNHKPVSFIRSLLKCTPLVWRSFGCLIPQTSHEVTLYLPVVKANYLQAKHFLTLIIRHFGICLWHFLGVLECFVTHQNDTSTYWFFFLIYYITYWF